MLRELLLALFLAVGLGLIVGGAALWSVPVALIIAGVGVIAIGVFFLAEVG